MKAVIFYITMSAKPDARSLAETLQQMHPDWEVCLYDRPHASLSQHRDIERWRDGEAIKRYYVDAERGEHGG